MNHTYKVLKSDIELFSAALFQMRVYVVSVDEGLRVSFEDYGRPVEKFSPESIKINGKYFFRDQFEFRVDIKRTSPVNPDRSSFYV
ncbi:hypothetical protein D3C74_168990 [compost metagenome]